ncbi:MAG: hypothetical protein HC799_13465 [Limnothrix sp. RL_2_0]|nr:hypothetical protein [Limnothrix sp. RL_2_0]
MKFQTTLAFTLLLLVAMVGAGTVSALYGFTLGYGALQGVKQPEGNPSQQLVRNRPADSPNPQNNNIELVSEREVIVAVYDKIYAKEQGLKEQAAPQPKSSFVKLPDGKTITPNAEEIAAVSSPFPLATEVEDISLAVNDVRSLGSYLVMDVTLQNSSRESIRFLYNFLELKDQDGRLLSAQTEGLPGEIPANNQEYVGTIRIPTVLVEEIDSISLHLSDYPSQEITLEILDIPMVR